jgi:hypothetical protein
VRDLVVELVLEHVLLELRAGEDVSRGWLRGFGLG